MHDSPETLSSAQTFLVKFDVPVFVLGAFSAAAISLFLAPEWWRDAPDDPLARWFVLAGIIVAWVLFWLFSAGLKAVRMDGSRVTFLPKIRMWLFPWTSHPVVEQIRRAVDGAVGRG